MLESNEDGRTTELFTEDRVEGLLIGRLVSVDPQGVPSVEYPGGPAAGPRQARSTVILDASHVGRSVALAFESGCLDAPIVIGVIRDPLLEWIESQDIASSEHGGDVDGERLVFEANKEIVLKCGQASITLHRDGKVLIRGTHLVSRSSGPNRIKGGSVQIN